MERLIRGRPWHISVLVGALTAAACAPYVASRSDDVARGPWILGIFMLAMATLTWQAYRAWEPSRQTRRSWRPRLGDPALVVAALVLLLLHRLWWIPLITRLAPQLLPDSHQAVLLALPFVAIFQPFIFLLWPWIIGWRVSESRWIAAAAMLGMSAVGTWLQAQSLGFEPSMQLAMVLARLPRFLLILLCFERWGYGGAASVSGLFWCAYLTVDLDVAGA